MKEKDLNIKYICDKTSLSENDELISIILDMIKESYKSGLCQAEYDNTMGLIEENEKLKLELSGYRQAILSNKEMLGLKEENEELKKQLETYEIEGYEQNKELNKMSFDIRKYKVQQKEFIKYLEDEIENSTFLKPSLKMILQKYKEIIGDDK